jgi:hypothetical protein
MTSRLFATLPLLLPLLGCPVERFSIPEVIRSGDLILRLAPNEEANVSIRTSVLRQEATEGEFRFGALPTPVGSYVVTSGSGAIDSAQISVPDGSTERIDGTQVIPLCDEDACEVVLTLAVVRSDDQSGSGELALSFAVAVETVNGNAPSVDLLEVNVAEE